MLSSYLSFIQGNEYEVSNADAFEMVEHGFAHLVGVEKEMKPKKKRERKQTREMRAGKSKMYVTK
jgi:hypothetical protein